MAEKDQARDENAPLDADALDADAADADAPDPERSTFFDQLPQQVLVGLLVAAILGFLAWLGWPPWEPARVGPGEPFDLGAFRYTLESSGCGLETIGGALGRERAQGEFCAFSLRIINTSDKSVGAADFWNLDSVDGETYSPEAFLDGWSHEDIFPGTSQQTDLVFDVPEGTEPETVFVKSYDAGLFGKLVIIDLN